ncbi:hydroxyphenylacetyl-CoA thioesterase PaaI [Ectothiorhodospiraceae bacterium WFHF3C12]|nr:hydroxyphenylacetyl-CoA thioesterase PaaI [Ectothiorhodospiraceae bacterium WFHF3C12]
MSEPTGKRHSAQEVAEACASAMWEEDKASQGLGMEIEAIAPGFARLSMTVREDMVNGHNICHGGFIFTLADSTFAFACNYRNFVTVASGGSVDFVAPARLGEILTATGEERTRAGRTGVYDVRVENGEGRLVALFRGRSHQTRNQLVPGLEVGE